MACTLGGQIPDNQDWTPKTAALPENSVHELCTVSDIDDETGWTRERKLGFNGCRQNEGFAEMPRYFFRPLNGLNTEMKNEGLDLPDKHAAWAEATTACGELLKDLDGNLKPGDKWQMQVKDDAGRDIYELEFRTKEY